MSYMQNLEARLHLFLENAGVPTEDRAPISDELKAIVLEPPFVTIAQSCRMGMPVRDWTLPKTLRADTRVGWLTHLFRK